MTIVAITVASTRLSGTVSIILVCRDGQWSFYKLEDDSRQESPMPSVSENGYLFVVLLDVWVSLDTIDCQSASKIDPLSASNFDPLVERFGEVMVLTPSEAE